MTGTLKYYLISKSEKRVKKLSGLGQMTNDLINRGPSFPNLR